MTYFLFLFINLTSIFATSITGTPSYTKICHRAAKNDDIFRDFKQNPDYQVALEHVTYDLGLEYLRILEFDYPAAINQIEKCKENDLLGNPKMYSYGVYGNVSPTTLRYMKVAGDLVKYFGDLKEKKIVEIGGGYGGQCKILTEISGFKNYTIIDLPSVSSLQKKYLSLMGIKNVEFFNNVSFRFNEHSYDLLISNYAFTGISKNEQLVYIEKVIKKSKAGYITCNFNSGIYDIKSLSLGEIVKSIEIPGRKIQILPEHPTTNSTNVIVIWNQK